MLRQTWAISDADHSDMIDENEVITDVKSVVMLHFRVGWGMTANATKFNNGFERDNPRMAMFEALLQMVMYCGAEYRRMHSVEKKVTYKHDPIKFRLEVVTAEGDRHAPLEDDESDGESAKSLYRTINYRTRRFMRGIPDDVPVVEYRLWVFCHEDDGNVQFNKIWRDAVVKSGLYYDENFSGTKAAKKAASKDAMNVSMYGGEQSASERFSLSLGDTEKWRLLRNFELLAMVSDTMLQKKNLTRAHVFRRVLSKEVPFKLNPANPELCFDPRLYFKHRGTPANNEQSHFFNYYDEETQCWRFPRADHVIRIGHSDQSLTRLYTKYLPDYQARFVADMAAGQSLPDMMRDLRIDRNEADEELAQYMKMAALLDDDEEGAAGSHDPFDERDDDELVDFDGSCLGRFEFEDQNSLIARQLLSPTDSPDRSDFHALRFEGARLQKIFDAYVATTDDDRERIHSNYRDKQEIMIRRYEDMCGSSKSKISMVGKKLNAWFAAKTGAERWLGGNRKLIDPSLSTFGNQQAVRMMRLESTAYVCTTHLTMLTILIGSLCVYRHQLDTLYFNVLLAGPAATSKSFMLKLLQKCRLGDTVVDAGEDSGRAGVIDTDKNDLVNIDEEVDPCKMKDSTKKKGGGDDSKEASFKKILTAQVVSALVFHYHESGKRDQRRVYSQQIQAFYMATNLDPNIFSEPILSRFNVVNVLETYRADRTPEDLIGIESKLDENGRLRRSIFFDEQHTEQFLHYHVEKLIACHILHDVTMSCTSVIQRVFRTFLRTNHAIPVKQRTFVRMGILVRQMTISLALEYLFSSPKSPHYGKPFQMRHLLDLDPLLHDTEEIVYFAIGLMRDQMVSNQRAIILQELYEQYIAAPISETHRSGATDMDNAARYPFFLTPNTINESSRTQSAVHTVGYRASSYGGNTRSDVSVNRSVPRFDAQIETFPSKYHNSYIRVPRSVYQASKDLASNMINHDVVVEFGTISKELYKLLKTTILGHQYEWDISVGFPVRRDVAKIKMPAAIRNGSNEFFVHLDLVKPKSNPIDEAIMACYNVHDTHRRRYIDGTIVGPLAPYLLRTRTIEAGQGIEHELCNYAKETTMSSLYAFQDLIEDKDIDEQLTNPHEILVLGYDALSTLDRANILYLDPEEACGPDGVCSFDSYERYAREELYPDDASDMTDDDEQASKMRYVTSRPRRYPKDFLPKGYAQNRANSRKRPRLVQQRPVYSEERE